MGGLFSSDGKKKAKKKAAALTGKDDAILDLKVARDRLKKFQKKTEGEAETYREKARALLKSGRKKKALLALRMKKFKEAQAAKVDGELLNLEQMVNNLEWSEHQMNFVETLRAGTDALKKMNSLMPIEKVEELMDDTREAIEDQDEISQILGESLTEADEADVLAELDGLVEADKDKSADDVSDSVAETLPEAPSGAVNIQQVEVEEAAQPERVAIPA